MQVVEDGSHTGSDTGFYPRQAVFNNHTLFWFYA